MNGRQLARQRLRLVGKVAAVGKQNPAVAVAVSVALQSSRDPSADQTLPENLLRRLRRLDAEQLHIITIVAAAIERGVR
jgi:hypothetical protein